MLPAIVLTGSRWCLLKRPESCTEKQAVKLKELVAINLKTVRAYIRSSVLSATADLLCLSRLWIQRLDSMLQSLIALYFVTFAARL